MLRRNKFVILFTSLFSALILSSCIGGGVYVEPDEFIYGVTILNKDNVNSDNIKIGETTKGEEKNSYLYNVVCSLRNNDAPKKIVVQAVSDLYTEGGISFVFSKAREENGKYNHEAWIYFENEDEYYAERDAQENNTSKYFITINDPDLDGYDPKYETVKHYCHDNLETTIYLGAAK